MRNMRKCFVSFTARLQNLPLPPARLVEEDPAAKDPDNASVPELRKATNGPAEDDLVLVGN